MIVLKQASNEVWYWNNTPIKLKDLHPNQLNSIRNTILKSNNKNWFNRPKDYWLESIKLVEKFKNKQATEQATNIIINNRIDKAKTTATRITNSIIKCINK